MKRLHPLITVPLKYALVASLLAVILLIILFTTGRHPLLIPIFYDYRILLFAVFIFFTLKEFKDYHGQGILHFWQGLLAGIMFYLSLGLLVGIFINVYGHLQPDFLTGYIEGIIKGLELNREQLTSQHTITITPEELDRQISLMKATKPHQMALDYFIKSCLIGFFLSILLAVILRRTDRSVTR